MADQPVSLDTALDFAERFAPLLEGRLMELAAAWPLGGERLRASAVVQVVEQVRAAFSTPLYEVLAAGWRTRPEARALADPAGRTPGEAVAVELAEHAVKWSCEPVVEVVADVGGVAGAALAEVRFRLAVEIVVRGGVLVVQDGRLMRVDAGELDVSGSLAVEGVALCEHEKRLTVPGSLRFGEAGVPIVPEPAPGQVSVPRIVNAPDAQETPSG